MAQLGNTPQQNTVLQLEQRKSYALMLRFMDTNRRLADLTDCNVRLVMKALPLPTPDIGDSQNIILNSQATITEPLLGECQLELQATDLDVDAAEYPYAIVLTTPAGYSIVAVKGVVAVQPNTEWSSLDSTYEGTLGGPIGLEVTLRGTNVLDVISSAYVPPGFTWMSDADKQKLDGLDIAANLLPTGGSTHMVLGKASAVDYDFTWFNLQAYDGTLSAEGIDTYKTPTADGAGGWDWRFPYVDWSAPNSSYEGYIDNKPTLGTAASADSSDFAEAEHVHDGVDITTGEVAKERLPRVIDLRGLTVGTAVPTGGNPGDLYLRKI